MKIDESILNLIYSNELDFMRDRMKELFPGHAVSILVHHSPELRCPLKTINNTSLSDLVTNHTFGKYLKQRC